MNVILSIGILIFAGYILGEIARKLMLPGISGYIVAGILLNPDLFGIMDSQFVEHTDSLLNIALSVITFSIGGSLSIQKIRATGRKMIFLMLFEALSAFIFVFVVVFLCLWLFMPVFDSIAVMIAVSLVLASLAAPTDPSATIAVIHEYRAKGVVSNAMLQIAAFDDVAGIIIYTLVIAISAGFIGAHPLELDQVLLGLGKNIGGALLLGFLVGILFNFVIGLFKNKEEGSLIVITLGMIMLSYGISEYLGFESLLAAMTLGMVVVNLNPASDRILKLMERYTDELIFVIFFTLSGLHLQLSSIGGSLVIIAIYIIARALGKFTGIYLGSRVLDAAPQTRKYAAGGLIPQGGVVIGLALLLTHDQAFDDSASMIIGIVIGAALIHEIIGPVMSRFSLKKAGEIQ